MNVPSWTTPLRLPIARLSALLLCLLLSLPSVRAQTTQGDYTFKFALGGTINNPQGLAVDAQDNLYVADTNNNRIVKFDSSLDFLGKIGSSGTNNGQFSSPTAVAVDSSGNLLVADSSNDRIQKFDSMGKWVWTSGGYGSGNGKFQHPTGVAVDGAGNVYVADTNNNRVQILNPQGVYVSQFGTKGSGNTNLYSPSFVAVDTAGGNLYVLDTGNNALKQFTGSGVWIWTVGGFSNPQGVTVDTTTGNVDVCDTGQGVIKQFDKNGSFIAQLAGHGGGSGQFANPVGIAVNSAGDIYVTDIGQAPFYPYNNHNRIQQLNSQGAYLNQFGALGYYFSNPRGVGVDSQGRISVADASDSRIMQFDKYGSVFPSFGGLGEGNGQFTYPVGLTVDGAGNIFVTDLGQYPNFPYDYRSRIQIFDNQGNYLRQFGSFGSGNGQFENPTSLALDTSGNIYVADQWNNRIQKFDNSGTYLTQFGSKGTGNGQFQYPTGVAVDVFGNIYVTDLSNDRIQKFNSLGVWVWSVGSYGIGPSQFQVPRGIAVDAEANVYVCDTGNNRVQKFDTNGNFITQLSVDVWGDAYASQVSDITVDAAGNVYITEVTNSRLVVLDAVVTARITGVSVAPGIVQGGGAAIGTVTLNLPAPAGGITVSLAASDSSTSAPAHLLIPQGQQSGQFMISTSSVNADTAVTIGATYNSTTRTAPLMVQPAIVLKAVVLSPSTLTGGTGGLGFITLVSPAPAGGLYVPLTSSAPAIASIPAGVTVPAGKRSAYFAVTTVPVSSKQSVTFSATSGKIVKSAKLAVVPAAIASVTLVPPTVQGGENSFGLVTLVKAVDIDTTITIKTTDPAGFPTLALADATVLIPAGETIGTFNISTNALPTGTPNQSVTFTATAFGISSKPAKLTVTP